MKRFLVVIEKAENNYSAYSPDLPGCVSTGKTREQAKISMANVRPDTFFELWWHFIFTLDEFSISQSCLGSCFHNSELPPF